MHGAEAATDAREVENSIMIPFSVVIFGDLTFGDMTTFGEMTCGETSGHLLGNSHQQTKRAAK